jgi:ATP-dependent Clp protease ATP-binding subunit ClpX
VPLEFGYSHFGRKTIISTADISFLACGAFSGFKGIIERRLSGAPMGLRQAPKPKYKEKIALRFGQDELEDVETFQSYGFLPELLGRFTRVLPFDPLDADTLKEILHTNVISSFTREFLDEGLALEIDPAVLDHLIEQSIKKQTGARGLTSILTRYIEDTAYTSFGRKRAGKKMPTVRLSLDKGEVISSIR